MAQLDRNERRFRVFAGVLLVAAVAVGVLAGNRDAGSAIGTVLAFAALATAVENAGLRLPTAVAVSPKVIIVTAAIAALHGHGVVFGVTVVGAAGGLHLASIKAQRFWVVAFNIGQHALTAAAAAASYDALATEHVALAVRFPAVAIVNVAVNVVLCLAGGSIRRVAPVRAMWADMRQAAATGVFFGVVGLLFGELYHRLGPITLVVTVGAVLVAHVVFLAVVRVRQAYTRLELLYRFTERLQRNRDEPDTVLAILEALRQALDAGSAELTLVGEDGWQRTTVRQTQRRPGVSEGRTPLAEAPAVIDGPVRIADLPADDPVRAEVVGRLGPHALIARMGSDDALVGILAVADPANGKPFGPEDLRLLEALTNHAAVSLDNSRLLGRLRYDSSHDLLTGLPNRTRFNELLADLPRPSAILLIDLDRFKEINDTLGHQHGDLLLRSVAERISEEVGHHGLVARLGGDEFGVLLPRTGSSNAAQTAVSLLAALEQPFHIGGLSLEITGSIGVAVAAGADADPARLLQQADVAMYSAKEAHSGWELYSTDRDHYSPRRLALAGELRQAIEGGEMEVHYQPKCDLRTGAVCGVEALVRWRHPRYGMLGPDSFIPVAESAGLIRPLTILVLTQAIMRQRALRRLGFDLGVAVNLSVRSVLDVHLPDQVAQVLDAHGVPPESLTLEITESSVMADPARTIGILGRLAGLGANISVDDFGTGYSSLSYLKRLPANEVKIDRTFVAGMLTTDSDAAIVRSTVDLARNLGLRAVAEGVEDEATWSALVELGCDFAQGYYLSPPLPADDLSEWLLNRLRTHDQHG